MAARTDDQPDDNLGLDTFRQPPEQAGLPLDRLSAAFAEMLGAGDDPYAPEIAIEDDAEPAAAVRSAAASPECRPATEDYCEITPRSILEAMLFVGGVGNQPLASQQVARLMRGVRAAEIDSLVRELNRDYAARNCPYQIVAEGAGYRMRLRDEFTRLRQGFYGKARQARLSQAAIEVLAIVAYHEHLTAEEIQQLRGKPSGAVLTQLVRRELVQLERLPEGRRQSRYSVTQRFLDVFGLESRDDLPRSPEVERL